VGGALLRAAIGIKPSTLNPRYCNDCELLSTEHPGGAETHVAMLFADIRGSTTLAQDMTPAAFSAVIDQFHRVASDILVDAGALIEKLIGDEATAIFSPGFAGPHYVRRAIDAGRRLLEAGVGTGDSRLGVPVGVGVHAGRVIAQREWHAVRGVLLAVESLAGSDAAHLLTNAARAGDPQLRAQAIEAVDSIADQALDRILALQQVPMFSDLATGLHSTPPRFGPSSMVAPRSPWPCWPRSPSASARRDAQASISS
jgi:adenylate cyclase